jgi:hypothetical protein
MLNGPAGDISQSGCAALSGEENFQSMLYPTSAAAGITISAGRTRVNGKALVGWLKAAVWCAIFICKHAAAKRAKLEKSED